VNVNMHWTDRLSEYQDGELSTEERSDCDAHLAGCDECRTILRELQLVTAAARADVDRDPTTDLWPAILTQIQASAVARDVSPATSEAATARSPRPWGPSSRQRHISFTLPQLALAASLLIAVSAGVSYVAAGRQRSTAPVPQERPIQAMAETLTPQTASDIAPANFADAQFDQAVADLEQILLNQRENLDPRTVMVIERNLAVIDDAIRQARAALDADPANTFLNSHLAEARRRKLDLLRRATNISSAAGD
jgi:negative regulator of sigma E activity